MVMRKRSGRSEENGSVPFPSHLFWGGNRILVSLGKFYITCMLASINLSSKIAL